MKKKFMAFVAAFVAACALCAFVACGGPDFVSNGESVVFTANRETLNRIGDNQATLKDYLDDCKSEGLLDFEGYDGEWGFYITSVNGTEADDTHFWLVYTDLVTLDGVVYSDPSYGTYEHNGKTLNSASYGVSSLPCIEGYTYALVYSSYSA